MLPTIAWFLLYVNAVITVKSEEGWSTILKNMGLEDTFGLSVLSMQASHTQLPSLS